MNVNVRLRGRSMAIAAVTCVMVLLGSGKECFSQDPTSQCDELRTTWERLVEDLRNNLNNYLALQKAPLEQVIQRPLVDRSEGKTIARQISEAIQAREKLLSAKRKECRNILNLEDKAFAEFEECSMKDAADRKDKRAFAQILRQRKSLVDKAVLSITEVRSVEGRETVIPYSQAYQDPYRAPENYWQNYQQMYRGYWGR
ncbi:MAG: hypothetical protein RDU20_15040 [Desulfomonilaceae bacterium]|nr:hypothetical protein [Desulfomonilaceae bacterium]